MAIKDEVADRLADPNARDMMKTFAQQVEKEHEEILLAKGWKPPSAGGPIQELDDLFAGKHGSLTNPENKARMKELKKELDHESPPVDEMRAYRKLHGIQTPDEWVEDQRESSNG